MNLRLQAALDLASIVEDPEGFTTPVAVTNPEGVSALLRGNVTDVFTTIDPETGMAITGRKVYVALALATLAFSGLGVPRGIADAGSKPWLVEFADILGQTHRFKVQEAKPDREIGLVTCLLEAYRTP